MEWNGMEGMAGAEWNQMKEGRKIYPRSRNPARKRRLSFPLSSIRAPDRTAAQLEVHRERPSDPGNYTASSAGDHERISSRAAAGLLYNEGNYVVSRQPAAGRASSGGPGC